MSYDRIRRALHPLDAPPTSSAWNRIDLADLLPDESDLVPAAVLVPIIDRDGTLTVLLTERDENLANHGGQVSFPGGRIDARDDSAVAAALRELDEEVGINASFVEPLGFLDPYDTVTRFRVTPVVARVRPGFTIVPQAGEVADVFEAPLSVFLDPDALILREIEYRGKMRNIHEFQVEGRRVWGATASMLLNLRKRIELWS